MTAQRRCRRLGLYLISTQFSSGNWAVSSVGRMRLSYCPFTRRLKMRSWVRAPGGPSILESCSTNVEDSSIFVSFSNDLLFLPNRVCQSLQRTPHTSKLYILFVYSLTKTREVQANRYIKKSKIKLSL